MDAVVSKYKHSLLRANSYLDPGLHPAIALAHIVFCVSIAMFGGSVEGNVAFRLIMAALGFVLLRQAAQQLERSMAQQDVALSVADRQILSELHQRLATAHERFVSWKKWLQSKRRSSPLEFYPVVFGVLVSAYFLFHVMPASVLVAALCYVLPVHFLGHDVKRQGRTALSYVANRFESMSAADDDDDANE